MTDLSISVHFDSLVSDAVQLEVDVRGKPFLFGIWDVDVHFKGRTLEAMDNWTETCVYNENDCEYLEIDLPLSKDYRLQRCFLLDHQDQLLILADTLLWDGPERKSGKSHESVKSAKNRSAAIEYEGRLLFSPDLYALTGKDTTEIDFYHNIKSPTSSNTKKSTPSIPIARVLPLSLPEWKEAMPKDLVSGSLDCEENALILRQQTTGCSLFAPLLFDLNPDRVKKPYTWRHLTVGQDLQVVTDDHAVGYRVQLAKEQYLLYRSMTAPANRTLLGHNLIDEFCFARFDPKSGVEGLVEVQQELD